MMTVQAGKTQENDGKAGEAGLAGRTGSRGGEDERAEKTRGMRRAVEVLLGRPPGSSYSFFEVLRKTMFCQMRDCFRHLVLSN